MRSFLGIAGVKKKPFKTTPYSLTYLVKNIHGFYNEPSPQYKIGGKNIINNHGPVKQRGYFNSDNIDIYLYGGHGLYKALRSVPRVPEGNY